MPSRHAEPASVENISRGLLGYVKEQYDSAFKGVADESPHVGLLHCWVHARRASGGGVRSSSSQHVFALQDCWCSRRPGCCPNGHPSAPTSPPEDITRGRVCSAEHVEQLRNATLRISEDLTTRPAERLDLARCEPAQAQSSVVERKSHGFEDQLAHPPAAPRALD